MKPTPYGETATLDDFLHSINLERASLQTPMVIRVIEREVGVGWIDDPDMTPEERLDTVMVTSAPEFRTFILDPEDVNYQDGILYLVVGSHDHPEDPGGEVT